MYELKQVGENTYYPDCPAKIGLYRLNNKEVCLIDSGNDSEASKKILRILEENAWNFRIAAQRLVVVKTKSAPVRKAAVLDVLTNLSFVLNVSENYDLDSLQTNKQYYANFKVYTSKDLEGVDSDFVNFFDALDVDQTPEDFIKAYWVYPAKIRFELQEVEEP
jgi:hypothetical protein